MTASPAPRGRAHPGTDARRSGDLLAILNRLVPAMAPGWSPSPDDFGAALLRIAAQLGEETTQRLDRTAQRDAIAASIRQHREGGDTRYTEPHEFTPNPDVLALVRQLLGADAPPAGDAALDAASHEETQPTVITECHDGGHVIVFEDDLSMAEAIAVVERIVGRHKTRFVIFQPDYTVSLYR